MTDYALIQIAQAIGPGLAAFGLGFIVLGAGIAIRALAGGSRKRLNELTERLLDLEEEVRTLRRGRLDVADERPGLESPQRGTSLSGRHGEFEP